MPVKVPARGLCHESCSNPILAALHAPHTARLCVCMCVCVCECREGGGERDIERECVFMCVCVCE